MRKASSKRTHTLKSLLERQVAYGSETKETRLDDVTNERGCTSLLLDFPEDQFNNSTQKTKEHNNPVANYVQSIELFQGLIDQELVKSAKELGIEPAQLKAWADLQIEVPAKTLLTLLRTIQALHLDPLNEEIGFTQYEDGQWQTFISVEGCSKLLNHHEQFHGLVFTQADAQIDGVPEWVECSIYRKDRILPITVREHYMEVKGVNPIWQKMPRRMLRHRALQQCVRLAIA
jgi:hypothetical protein